MEIETLLNSCPVAIFHTDANGNLDYVNECWRHLTQLTANQFRTNTWLTAVHADDRARVEAQWREALNRGASCLSEYRLRCPESASMWVLSQTVPETNLAGEVIGYVGTLTDITQQKRTEDELGSQYLELRQIIDNSTAVIYVKDTNGRYLLVNRQYENAFHVKNEEMKGKTDYSLFPKEAADAYRANDLQVLERCDHLECEEVVPQADGPHSYISLKVPLFDVAGKPYAVCGISTDITDRKNAHEDLLNALSLNKATLDATADGILVVDRQGRIVSYNRRFAELWRIPDEILNSRDDTSALAFVFDQLKDPQAFIAKVKELYASPAAESFDVLEFKDDRLFERYSGPQRIGSNIVGRVWSFRDVTKRRHAEDEVRALNAALESRIHERTKELASVNKELESFAYSISHDLRTPLRAIDGFSLMLQNFHSANLEGPPKLYLQRIRQATQYMAQLIDDILMLSRVTRTQMQNARVDLSALVKQTTSELQEREPQRLANFVIAPEIAVQGDPNLLLIAITNLTENAWKFTSKCDVAAIEFGSLRQSGRTVYFIRDNGVGFDMAYANKLFHPFQRLHRGEEFPGTGVGLSIVSRIIQRHGGSVWAEGAVDHGATFYFTL